MEKITANKKVYLAIGSLQQPEDLFGHEGTFPFYEIWWIKEGRGGVFINAERYEIAADTIYCFPAGKTCRFEFLNGLKGYALTLSGDYFRKRLSFSENISWVNSFIIEGNTVVLSAATNLEKDLDPVFCSLSREFAREDMLRAETFDGLLNLLAIYFSRKMTELYMSFVPSKELVLVRRFENQVSNHLASRKLVADYARQLRVSAHHLNRAVKRITGYTASQYIQRQVVQAAKRMAIQSNSSMKEIANGLGFDDHCHFSRFFRANCGMTFSHFKHCYSVYR
jgi:AraC family transcriptional regulator, transcriptional activator of pobA